MNQLITLALVLNLLSPYLVFADSESKLTIGLLAELTGPNAPNGESCRQGYELAQHWLAPDMQIAGHALQLIYADHRGEAATAVSEFRRLVDQAGSQAVISIRSQVGMALNPISQALGIPLLGIVGHSEFTRGNSFAFRFFPSTRLEGQVLSDQMRKLGRRRTAIISLEDEWTISLGKAFSDSFRSADGQIVFSQSVLGEEIDFLPILTRLRKYNPDSIVVNLGVGQSGLLIRQIRELGFKQPIYANFWASYPQVIDAAGAKNIGGVEYVSVNLAKPKFQKLFAEKFPSQHPSAATYCCFSALSALLQLVHTNPTAITRTEIGAAMKQMLEVQLPDETLKMNKREVEYDVVTMGLGASVL